MQCRLCLEEKKLQRKSHIIPQFMHNQLLSEEGYLHKIKKDTYKNFLSGKLPKEFKTGEYESDILCRCCDNGVINQRYEDYSSKVYQLINGEIESFQDIKIENYENPKDMSGKKIKNIDYSKFRLFLLSVLWRASIAKRDLFTQVKLGSAHEEILRTMILNGDPKEPDDYPCFIYDMRDDQPLLEGWILPPRLVKADGNISYEFMISGLAYRFTISKFARPVTALAGVIDKDNSMIIWKAPEGFGKYYYSKFREYYYRIAETE